jgi:hypothetical protein
MPALPPMRLRLCIVAGHDANGLDLPQAYRFAAAVWRLVDYG